MVELALAGLALVLALAPTSSTAVERWFSTGVYPRVQRVITTVTNVAPFALFDLLLVAAVVAILVILARSVRATLRTRQSSWLLAGLVRIGAGVAAGYIVFLLLWGFNYRRVPMTERLAIERDAPSADSVERLGMEAVQRMNALYLPAHADGWPDDPRRDVALRNAFDETQHLLSDAPTAVPGRLKWTLLGPYFRWTSVDGMVNPFGLEVLANPDLLPFERPFVAAHEWAHLAGYADESDANFVGWLTTIRADLSAQYSGWLYLFWQVNGEVAPESRTRLWDGMHPGPRKDVEAVIARLRRSQLPWLRTAGWAVYDQYLKANRVETGVRSYGAVVTLILRARFEDGWTPVRRAGAAAAGRPGS